MKKRSVKRAHRRVKVKKLEKKFFAAVNDAYWEVKRSGVQR